MAKEQWYNKSTEEILSKLGTSLNGLSSKKAEKRLKEHGPNKLKKKKRVIPLQILFRQFKSFLIMILVAAAAISALFGSFIDTAVIIAIIILNAVLGFFQEYKAERAMEALEKLAAHKAHVIRDGKRLEVLSEELVPGDILALEVGDKVAADSRILESFNLRLDESALTGESTPVSKSQEVLKGKVPLSERSNIAYMNTIVIGGRSRAVIVGTGMNTEIGKIAEMIQTAEKKQTPLQKKMQEVGRDLGIIIIFICAVVFLLGFYRGGEILETFIVAISLAVAAVPEGLPAIITITLALGLQKMAKSKAIVRRLPAVETLGSTTVICSDKTGTLTKNQMTVSQVYVDGKFIEVSGTGYQPTGEFTLDGEALDELEQKQLNLLLKIGALCNNAELIEGEEYGVVGDPTEGSLVVLAMKAGMDPKALVTEHPRIHELEFTSTRKRMTTVHKTPEKEIMVFAKGAPEVLLNYCNYIYTKNKRKKLTKMNRDYLLKTTQTMAEGGLRVLGFAYRDLPEKPGKLTPENLEKDMTFVGIVGMMDPVREEVGEAIDLCQKAGIKAIMITGDHELTAQTIADKIGMLGKKNLVVTGAELDKLSDEELDKRIENISVYARVSPEHKVRILKAFQKRGHVVAMTGDGINDAPALKNADIGIAIGTGTDVAKEAADMILEDNNFATIVTAVREGRGIFDNIKKFIALLLSGNIGEVLIIAIAILIGFTDPATGKFVLPLIATQILWINMLTDGLPAVALSVEPVEEEIMKRKPRHPRESVFKGMRAYIVEYPIIMLVGILLLFAWTLKTGGILKAQTMVFTSIVMFELFQSFSCRSLDKPIFNLNFFSNKYLIVAVLSSFLLQLSVLYIPFLQKAFHTVSLGLFDWAIILLVASIGFIYLESYKALRAHFSK